MEGINESSSKVKVFLKNDWIFEELNFSIFSLCIYDSFVQ
jgi:hypothetical protein